LRQIKEQSWKTPRIPDFANRRKKFRQKGRKLCKSDFIQASDGNDRSTESWVINNLSTKCVGRSAGERYQLIGHQLGNLLGTGNVNCSPAQCSAII
jgi:hypothetical protein